MSVIIEGLTLPKHNPKEIDKNVLIGYAIVKEDNTAELCLEGVRYLIKMLPTPHGRLIGADALVNRIKNNYCNKCTAVEECGICVCQNCGVATLFDEIENSTTIIEAEVSE